MTTITYDDFAARDQWSGGKWYKHSVAEADLWDAAARAACAGSLVIEARRFTLTRRNPHDNVKALVYSTAAFSPGPRGIVTVEAEMRVETFGTEANPFGADPGDVRLGCGAFNTIDLRTSMVFDFFVSGTQIVPLYERLPFTLRADNQYPLFSELIPIRVSTAPGQWHRYGISYDRAHDRVEWRVDGAVVAERTAVGAPPGERGPIVKIEAIKIGGGLFTMLGDRNSDRVRTGDGKTIPGLDPQYERTLFGQGARVEFGPFRVDRE
ncbi:MAG: DUF6081 family protein [Xanthobacteraceae bacterium]